MKKVTLLSISNSFGVNLQTYAHQIALENGIDLDIYVLYIGGCPLERHYRNLLANSKDYELFHNGESTHEFVSILDGLKIYDEWDYIITQQASQLSGRIETYEPYLRVLYDYININAKYKRFGLQATWAYGPNMQYRELFEYYNYDCDYMFDRVHEAYYKASENYNNCLIIRSGDIIREAKKELGINLYDDADFHMNNLGNYLIGANLIRTISNEPLKGIYVDERYDANLLSNIVKFVNKFHE